MRPDPVFLGIKKKLKKNKTGQQKDTYTCLLKIFVSLLFISHAVRVINNEK